MSFGSLFGKSVKDFKINFKGILCTVFFFITLPQLIFPLVSLLLTGSMITDFSKGISSMSLVSIITGIAFSLFTGFLWVFAISGITRASLKNKFNFQDVISFGKKSWLKYLGLFIVSGIFLCGLFLLLIIPGIIFFVYWFFSFYAIFDENKGILHSLKRSKELVKGNWWRICGYLLIITLLCAVIWIITLIPSIPFQGDLLLGKLSLISSIEYLIINATASTLSSLIFYGFFILFYKNIYLELKNKIKPKKYKVMPETKGFVWYYTRASLFLLSLFIILSFFVNSLFLLVLTAIFTLIISVTHLIKHKKKTIAVITLVISAMVLITLLFILTINLFSHISGALEGMASINQSKFLINYTDNVLPIGYHGTPNFMIYISSNISINLAADDLIDTILLNQNQYYNYENNVDYYYIENSKNVTYWELTNYTLPGGKYYIVIDPLKNKNLTYNLTVFSVPNV